MSSIYIQNIRIDNEILNVNLYNGESLLTKNITFNTSTIKDIKYDGLFLIIFDINNGIWQFEYNAKNNLFVAKDVIRPFYLKHKKSIKINPLSDSLWCVQKVIYKNIMYYSTETIFCKETFDNTIKVYDPWINPDKNYNISYPADISPIVMDSSHRTLALLTIDKICYRKVNFDLAGYNPFIKYTYNGKLIHKTFGHFSTIEINTPDFFWQYIDIPYNTYNIAVIDDIIYAYNGQNYFTYINSWEIYETVDWNYKFIKMKYRPNIVNFTITINDKIYSEPFYDETEDEYILKVFSSAISFLACKYKYIKIKK